MTLKYTASKLLGCQQITSRNLKVPEATLRIRDSDNNALRINITTLIAVTLVENKEISLDTWLN